jgi:hypothetical protein
MSQFEVDFIIQILWEFTHMPDDYVLSKFKQASVTLQPAIAWHISATAALWFFALF